ncbi:hypothetical protein BaRGS_00009597, partial [Batillaria attramentaria]
MHPLQSFAYWPAVTLLSCPHTGTPTGVTSLDVMCHLSAQWSSGKAMEKLGLSTKRSANKAGTSRCPTSLSAATISPRTQPSPVTPSPPPDSPGGQAAFLQKVRQASEAVSNGDFRRAVQAYTEAIQLDPSNHILYTNRAAARFKLGRYSDSVQDARAARQLNPKWAK